MYYRKDNKMADWPVEKFNTEKARRYSYRMQQILKRKQRQKSKLKKKARLNLDHDISNNTIKI